MGGRFGARRLLAPSLAILALVVGLGAATAGLAERRAQQTAGTFFGVYAWSANAGIPAGELATAQQIGAGSAQVLIDWNQIEFTEAYNDVYTGRTADFDYTAISPVDRSVGQVAAAGLQPILLIANPPAWALETPGTQGPLKSDKIAKYASFVRRIVERYSRAPYDVRHVVLAPEPDARGVGAADCGSNPLHAGWGDQPTRFAELLRQTYPQIKAVRSDVQVVLGALAYDSWCGANAPSWGASSTGLFNYTFLDDVLAAGGAGNFDVLAFNSYTIFAPGWEANSTGYDVAAKANYIRNRFPQLATKALMVLEAGVWSDASVAFPVRMPDGSIGTIVPTEQWQAGYPAKLFSRGLAANLAGVLWYGMRDYSGDVQRGLLDRSGNPKRVVQGYRQATLRLAGATYAGAIAPRDVSGGTPEGYLFDLPTGGRMAVVWAVGDLNSQATLTVDLPGGNVRAYDEVGNPVDALRVEGDAATLTVGHSPIYLLSGRPTLRTMLPLGLRNSANP